MATFRASQAIAALIAVPFYPTIQSNISEDPSNISEDPPMTLTDLVRSLPVARDIVQSAASVLQPSVRSNATVSIATLVLG
jgi:hypothetical protein